MITAGVLEEMFSGYGLEYLWFKPDTNYAVGFEVFDVRKRDHKMRFGHLSYKNITSHVNLYYRNYGIIPFDAKFSFGEYLAGDVGGTIELSRTFSNGTRFGIFATKTNVSSRELEKAHLIKEFFLMFLYLGILSIIHGDH